MKVSIELEDLVRLAGVQHEAPAPPAEPEIPSDDGAPVGGGCGMHPTQDMRDTIQILSPQEGPVEEEVYEHESDDFENASPEFSGSPMEVGDIDDMSFRGFGKTRGKEADSGTENGDNPLNEVQLMAEWQDFKKKDLTTPVKVKEADLNWLLNLASKNVGGLNLGVNANKDGLGVSAGKGPLSVSLGNVLKWPKGEKKRSAPDNKSTTSRQRYDVTLRPGQPGYKSLKRRRQEAAMRNQ